MRRFPPVAALVCALLFVAVPVFAQGGAAASIVGTVTDTSGGVLPGADVVAVNNATRGEFRAVTSDQGSFTIPAVNAGTYTVTVSLMGFKTVTINDVAVNAGVPAAVKAALEVGGIAETVTVEAGAELLQTQTAAVATTLDIKQVTNLPLANRNALDFVTFLPGVQTANGSRDSIVNGLPQSAINITLDGASVQDNFNKTTDGFFARLSPHIDAVEEVTVTTASNGADSNGQGAVQIRFVTRSGSNDLRGSFYSYFRHDGLNANTWFNNRDLPADPETGKAPKSELRQYEPGFNIGGPIVIPGVWDGHNKGFFFFNYSQFRRPQKITRDRVLLHPAAMQGNFRYTSTPGGPVQQINLFELAARNGQVSTADPTIARLFSDIRASTSQGQLDDLSDPLLQRLTFQTPQKSLNHLPTGRLDFNLSARHRLTASFNYNHINSNPDTTNNVEPRFPGFLVTGSQQSSRYSTSNALRSTISNNMVNELRIGATGGATHFSPELKPELWTASTGGQGGFHLNINNACCSTALANAGVGGGQSSREASTKFLENTLTWIKGNHTVSFGGNYTQADVWLHNQLLVPEIRFDAIAGTPAASMFTVANFPGASTTNLNNARRLYAILVGSVSEVRGIARLDDSNTYQYGGLGRQVGRLKEYDVFASDSWRVRPNLTVNAGLRYMVQMPFYSLNSNYSTGTMADIFGVSGEGNIFKPGTLTGARPTFKQYTEGTRAYNIDWNNVAPSIGVTWSPSSRAGFLRHLLGNEEDTVFRAGYSLGYTRPGMSDFTGVFGDNPGVAIDVFRNNTLGNLGPLPLLLRDTARLGPAAFPSTPSYPLTEVVTGDMEIFSPDLQVPYSQSWSIGVQRSLGRNMAVDASYIGTRHTGRWIEFDYNEVNIVENGFLNEFRLAQANLQANIAAGRGNNFRYFGPGTGTAPLPIYLAYFAGLNSADNPASYTSALFQDTAFVNHLARFNPNPRGAVDLLDADSGRIANALRAGLPANFIVTNPDLLGGAQVFDNGGDNQYHGLQLKLTKRYSQGFTIQTSYALGEARETTHYSFRRDFKERVNAGDEGSVKHAIKGSWVWDLPFGSGRRFAGNAGGGLERLVGGWSIGGTARIQSGQLLDFGNVRLVGMSKEELADMFKLRFDDAGRAVFMLPQDVIDNTVRAWNVSATSPTGYGIGGPPSGRYIAPANGPDCIEIAQGYGDCGVFSAVVTGPALARFDFSIVKRLPLAGGTRMELRAELLNAFNRPWFEPVTGNTDANLSVTSPNYNSQDEFRLTDLAGSETSRVVQLIARFTW